MLACSIVYSTIECSALLAGVHSSRARSLEKLRLNELGLQVGILVRAFGLS